MAERPALRRGRRPGRILRTWDHGDTVALELPMAVTLTRWEKNNDSVSINRGPLTYSVKIGEKYVRQHPEQTDDKWPAYEILPTTPWNYGLALDAVNPLAGVRVVKKPFPADNQPFTLADAPVRTRGPGKTDSQLDRELLRRSGQAPAVTDQVGASRSRLVTMVPMGCARLRMSALPIDRRTARRQALDQVRRADQLLERRRRNPQNAHRSRASRRIPKMAARACS